MSGAGWGSRLSGWAGESAAFLPLNALEQRAPALLSIKSRTEITKHTENALAVNQAIKLKPVVKVSSAPLAISSD